jgi:hydrogenase expression/formation protein HypC
MCVAVPAKVVELKGDQATVEIRGNRFDANVSLVGELNIGDYVLIHAGFAIERYEPEEAQEVLKVFEELLDDPSAP